MLCYGIIMLLFMLFLPGGLDAILKKWISLVSLRFQGKGQEHPPIDNREVSSVSEDIHMSILHVTNLRKEFGGLTAVNDVDFELADGHITSLIGPNGAGKTTIINLITGFLPLTKGSIFFHDREITSLPAYK